MSTEVCLTCVGVVMLRDRGDTSDAVTFTLELVVMWAERVCHKIMLRPLIYVFRLIPALLGTSQRIKKVPGTSSKGWWEAVLLGLEGLG